MALAAVSAGLDASLLWAALPRAVLGAGVQLQWVGAAVGAIAACHSLGQLLGAALLWHGKFRPFGELSPLHALMLGQTGLLCSLVCELQ